MSGSRAFGHGTAIGFGIPEDGPCGLMLKRSMNPGTGLTAATDTSGLKAAGGKRPRQ